MDDGILNGGNGDQDRTRQRRQGNGHRGKGERIGFVDHTRQFEALGGTPHGQPSGNRIVDVDEIDQPLPRIEHPQSRSPRRRQVNEWNLSLEIKS